MGTNQATPITVAAQNGWVAPAEDIVIGKDVLERETNHVVTVACEDTNRVIFKEARCCFVDGGDHQDR